MRQTTFYLFIIISLIFNRLNSQCTPAAADNCEDANVLCSLSELNGYSCKNPDYSNPTGCSPLCPTGGLAHNTGWWAFVTKGGEVCITITFNNCSVNGTGVQFGIWGDCACGESITCDPSCNGSGTKMMCANFIPCKTYYFFVDGCSNDVCEFTLTTKGGEPPVLPQLKSIAGPTEICKDACNVEYLALSSAGSKCQANFQWSINGVELDQYTNKLSIDFPDKGIFLLCVSTIVGNQFSGSICDQEGPKCITIHVRDSVNYFDTLRYVCSKQFPFIWGKLKIDTPGIYRQNFNSNCCNIDSVIHFISKDFFITEDVYYLGCEGDQYEDQKANVKITTCQDSLIVVTGDTLANQCYEAYTLHAAFMNIIGEFKEFCQDGNQILEFLPNDKTCMISDYQTDNIIFKWYLKNDSLRKPLGYNEQLVISCDKKEYCVEIVAIGQLKSLFHTCTFTICEQMDESSLCIGKICPSGKPELVLGDISEYSVDTLFPADATHVWTVTGGYVLTQDPEQSKKINVIWNFIPAQENEFIGSVCYQMKNSCGKTPKCCIPVKVTRYGTGISDLREKEILNVFPNPVSKDQIYIEGGIINKDYRISITDLGGRIYYEKSFFWNKPPIIIKLPGEMKEGVYLVKIIDFSDKFHIKKLIRL